ncbi:MAG: mannose-1-phosphate guanylyltransferase/mannose-6-phosphate isomerase [Rhodospirillales bacterium]|nr:mannose-1-phosphate guanylyltransferase/mannose-6-phosphate isomerase [Rhodospirillales bacterium]
MAVPTPVLTPVILSGGAGTRLWPLSRALRPKQLLALASDHTMLQETVSRVRHPDFAAPLIVCNQEHRFMIAEQMRALDVTPQAIVLEPAARNTAPAIVIAALFLAERDPDAVMLVLPSDHVIDGVESFHTAVAIARSAAESGALVTFGIPPTKPETGYGYIRRGNAFDGIEGCYRIDSFVEKPSPETAAAYVAAGDYAWNSGMFVLPVAAFLDEVRALKPEMLQGCRQALAGAVEDLDFLRLDAEAFAAIESVSIDYAVMERTGKGVIVPADMGWSDVGSWSALWEISEHDADGNVTVGDVIAIDAHNSYVRGDGKLVAVVGIDDMVVVSTDDVVLVARKDRAQDVRDVVEALKAAGRNEHQIHTRVFRPWGWYQGIDAGSRFQVKQICVYPGQALSSQMHHHRAEHWIVVSGTAKVSRGDASFYLTENESAYIPHNTRHRLENPGRIPLRLIEVQTGGYLGEDDIIRYGDHYGRAQPDRGS